MEIGSVDQMAMNAATATAQDAVGMAVLKKALQLQATNAAQLIQMMPKVTPSANLPSHLGQNVNTTA
jgi:hypothetical protein